jgi:hypothetical protein
LVSGSGVSNVRVAEASPNEMTTRITRTEKAQMQKTGSLGVGLEPIVGPLPRVTASLDISPHPLGFALLGFQVDISRVGLVTWDAQNLHPEL